MYIQRRTFDSCANLVKAGLLSYIVQETIPFVHYFPNKMKAAEDTSAHTNLPPIVRVRNPRSKVVVIKKYHYQHATP